MKVLRTVSWVLLTVAAALMIAGGLGSAFVAYRADPAQDVFGTAEGAPTMKDVTEWRPEIATAVRARRGTAAAYAVGYAVLLLILVLVPYRRGEVWAWWAILAGSLVVAALYLLRVPTLGTTLGAGVGATQLAVVALALLLDTGRLRGPRPAA